ncbi:hypothetical protein L1987_48643 [Smallanthus sonchifolius]|uniref:Uncharacterized protein n=1 Tax=Smallanthus sonchifolius TaxID=185202 RepID=A0ACB9FTE5_9ASTR|nr:hypothetical protein L1987_48643 [Smallanthus sonchifolius]
MFGWRKASKCKKLMKKLRCRLNLLKNKRCCIVRQLRNDVAQLIKHGHHQTAFNRVDQIYKDECVIAVYDLLAHFCEFLSLQLSYIRRIKDCPNDINEAISSLIFASARCGELPELLRIRKLFSQRYGELFEARALDLLPGNLVNFQIREYLSMNKVPNQVKSKLVEEITTTVLQTGPLALEFTSEQGQRQATNGTGNDQIANADFSPSQSNFDHPAPYHQDRLITYHVEAESSSEIIYHDDIEEFQSPLKDGENEKDQRVFMFTSTAGAGNHKIINLLISIIEKLADSMKVKRQSRKRSGVYIQQTMLSPGDQNGIFVKPIGEPARAMSMPCNRRKKCVDEDGVMRCYSLPVERSSPHVHPKLPDYDELAATFMALKKEKVSKPGDI